MTRLSQVKSIYLNKEAAKPFFSNRIAKVNATFPNYEKYATQPLPATELRVISQPSGSAKIDRYKNYVYRTDKRKETYIYHAELGINADHEDFQGVPIEWDWTDLQVRRGGRTKGEAPSWYFGHSTCTASKAAGRIYGSAKQERLVVIKMPDYTTASLAEIMWTIYNHVYDHGRRDRSVVTISWGSIVPVAFPLDPQNDLWLAVYEAMTALWSLGVVIFCAAGNDAQELNAAGRPRTLVDTAPAVFQLYAAVPPMVVVGNVNNYGYRHPTSQRTGRGDGPQVHAPGVKVQCASPTSTSDSRFDTGTSFCKHTIPRKRRISLTCTPSWATRSRRSSRAHGGGRNWSRHTTSDCCHCLDHDAWLDAPQWWRIRHMGPGFSRYQPAWSGISQC